MQDVMERRDGRVFRELPKAVNINGNLNRNDISAAAEKTTNVSHDGFNTILNCCWCGGKSREVYIPQLKNGKNGKPYEIVYNYEACPACKKKWADMVVIIEITEKEPYTDCMPIDIIDRETGNGWDNINHIKVPLYPTGRHVGVTEQAAKEGIGDQAKNGDIYFMDEESFSDIFNKEFQ